MKKIKLFLLSILKFKGRQVSKLFAKHWLKAYSGLSINISAAWFILAMATPNFSDISQPGTFSLLIRDSIFGIIFLLISVKIEGVLENE